jgi:hypothetical protein
MNRGHEAIFRPLNSPATLDLNSTYQGVFLNQNEQFNPAYPI